MLEASIPYTMGRAAKRSARFSVLYPYGVSYAAAGIRDIVEFSDSW